MNGFFNLFLYINTFFVLVFYSEKEEGVEVLCVWLCTYAWVCIEIQHQKRVRVKREGEMGLFSCRICR